MSVTEEAKALYGSTGLHERHHVGYLVVAGSHAYGLETPESDIDLRGFFYAEPRSLLGLTGTAETVSRTHPDITLHEAKKYLNLALNANPTILETLAVEEELVLSNTEFSRLLRENIHLFYSNKVITAYLGYAHSQFQRFKNRQYESFSSDTAKRTEKHIRHLLRLCEQAEHLLRTGELVVRLPDPDKIREQAQLPYPVLTELVEKKLADLKATPSVLPDKPDTHAISAALTRERYRQLLNPKAGE